MLRQIKRKADNFHSGGSVSPVVVVPVGKGIADVHRFCAGSGFPTAWFPEFWRGGTASSRKKRAASFLPFGRYRFSKKSENNSFHTRKSGNRIRLHGTVSFRPVGDETICKKLQVRFLSFCKTGLSQGLRVKKFILRGKRRATAPFLIDTLFPCGIVRNRAERENQRVASCECPARSGTSLRYRFYRDNHRGWFRLWFLGHRFPSSRNHPFF